MVTIDDVNEHIARVVANGGKVVIRHATKANKQTRIGTYIGVMLGLTSRNYFVGFNPTDGTYFAEVVG